MSDTEKAIELLKSDIGVLDNYLKSRPNDLNESYFENELIKDMQFAISALEKQTEKKIICETVDEYGVEYEFEHYKCPNCKNIIHQRFRKSKEPMRYKQNYCIDCGQKLDWSDKN